jgi:Fe-S-cluster containining protein
MASKADIPWYAAGLAFECQECGNCCSGPEEGYVWATAEEIDAIAGYLEMDRKEFQRRFVRRVGLRFSLVERKKVKDCIFLEDGRCAIYPVRPRQCRTWPFWKSNISSPDDWCEASGTCPGINRGDLHSAEKIRQAADATQD